MGRSYDRSLVKLDYVVLGVQVSIVICETRKLYRQGCRSSKVGAESKWVHLPCDTNVCLGRTMTLSLEVNTTSFSIRPFMTVL